MMLNNDFSPNVSGVMGIADGVLIEYLSTKSEVRKKIATFRKRLEKYEKRGISMQMWDAFDYMKNIGLLRKEHFHNEFFHSRYCGCLFCSKVLELYSFPPYVFLKSYKLKMLYFQAVKNLSRKGYYEKKKQRHLQRLRDEKFRTLAKESVRQTDWMLSVSHDEYLQALSRLDLSNPASVSNWMNEERERHEQKN